MVFQHSLKGLAAAFVFGAMAQGAPAAAAEMDYAIVGPSFADDYHGYHLRGPYYLRDGWRYAPTHSRPHPALLGYHDPYAPAHRHYRHREHRRVVVVVPSNGHRVANWAHVEWCLARYRSYRVRDNTFQPNHGWRKQCWSPYG